MNLKIDKRENNNILEENQVQGFAKNGINTRFEKRIKKENFRKRETK
jgi:hypothetical protein